MKHTTLLGRELTFDDDPKVVDFYERLLAAPSSDGAETMLVNAGIPRWTDEQLLDPRWAYFVDAVDRVRAREGSLRVLRTIDAPLWSTNEVARSLGISIAGVQQLAASGRLSSTKANGRTLFERHEVEAFELVRSGPSASRVPALYVTIGTLPSGEVMRVAALDSEGYRAHGETLSSRNTPRGYVDDLVFESWAEAVLIWGTTRKQQGMLILPSDKQVSRIALGPLDELGAVGRWAVTEATSNHSRAAAMMSALHERAKDQP